MLSVVGRRFHIIGARRLIRTVCQGCITCRKVAARTETQIMGQFPIHRVTPSPTFTKSGIDFAGPLLIRKHTRKPVYYQIKCLYFVCFATNAVHLELVSDLTMRLSLRASDASSHGEVFLLMYFQITVLTLLEHQMNYLNFPLFFLNLNLLLLIFFPIYRTLGNLVQKDLHILGEYGRQL